MILHYLLPMVAVAGDQTQSIKSMAAQALIISLSKTLMPYC